MKFSTLITAALHKEVFSLSLLTQFCSFSKSDSTLAHPPGDITLGLEEPETLRSADTDYDQGHSSFFALPGNKVLGFYRFVKEN